MKFTPRHGHVVGRMTIPKSESTIILLDATKVTKFVLVDACGPDATAAGIKVGDVVVVTRLNNIVLNAGRTYMPLIEEKDVALFVTEIEREELLVQSTNGKNFVPFDSDEAAPCLGVQPISVPVKTDDDEEAA